MGIVYGLLHRRVYYRGLNVAGVEVAMRNGPSGLLQGFHVGRYYPNDAIARERATEKRDRNLRRLRRGMVGNAESGVKKCRDEGTTPPNDLRPLLDLQ